MKPSVILGVPSYVYHVLREAKERGCQMGFIKKVVLGAARLGEGFKERLAGLLSEMGADNTSVFGTYGFTEARCAWAECPTGIDVSSGYHLYPDKEIFEIVDPKTGEVKGEEEDGELVYTSIDARGSVVLRYRTGDFVKGGITYDPCPYCRRRVARISSDITRLSDVKDLKLSKIKGSLVNLNNFTSILAEIKEIDEWQIELRKKNNDPFEVDQVVVYLCPAPQCDRAKVEEEIKKKMLLATEVTPNEIHFVTLQEMVDRLELEVANKAKRIIDTRPKK
jgi:phenylacetate-coenzyme A ligase PaaK-like adenylate-forming protein